MYKILRNYDIEENNEKYKIHYLLILLISSIYINFLYAMIESSVFYRTILLTFSLYILNFCYLVFKYKSLFALKFCSIVSLLFFFNYAEFASNHMGLVSWLILLTLVYDLRKTQEKKEVYKVLVIAIIIFFFFTGFQKLIYGTYFKSQFLVYMINSTERFASVFKYILSDVEFKRILSLNLQKDSLSSNNLTLLFTSNIVILFELIVPILMLIKRNENVIYIAMIFTICIQIVAREYFFAIIFLNCLYFLTQKRYDLRIIFISNLILSSFTIFKYFNPEWIMKP